MISEIQIKDCASFDHTGITARDLKEINFIYGPNGSGKTTIANVIAEPHNYPRCTIAWKNKKELKSFIYNRSFIDENFGRRKTQKGIFTLGKDETDAKETIEAHLAAIRQINAHITNDISAIELHNASIESMEQRFTEDCWKIHTRLKDLFKPAFKGVAIKVTFKERCKAEMHNSSPLLELSFLKEKAARIYSGSSELLPDIALLNYNSLLQTQIHEIWAKKIIGKEDVEIAALIQILNNSDWVKQGLSYYAGQGDRCPFCQQKAPENLEQQLNDYFDQTYLALIKTLHDLQADYSAQTDEILSQIGELINSKNPMIDLARLEELRTQLIFQMKANMDQIQAKIKEPGRVLVLAPLSFELEKINELVQQARLNIALHNDTVKNLARESAQLTREVWRYIAEQLKTTYQRFQSDCAAIVKIIEGLEIRISENEQRIKILRAEISQLEILGTNTVQTKNDINALLAQVGFTGFQLAEATEEKGTYQITRMNGQRVERTLSEGEKTFVTFLYFYHLLKGSLEREAISDERVVVIDDPVTNLDVHSLYIVSQLIKNIIDEIRSSNGNIRQLIVLTHHVDFYTRVSHDKQGEDQLAPDVTFWMLRKELGFSKIRQYERNPIHGSYGHS